MTAPEQSAETGHIDWDAVARVEARIDNLYAVAGRWDRPGGSPRLAQRARDKAEGMETALRLMGVCERGVFGDPLIHHLLTNPEARRGFGTCCVKVGTAECVCPPGQQDPR